MSVKAPCAAPARQPLRCTRCGTTASACVCVPNKEQPAWFQQLATDLLLNMNAPCPSAAGLSCWRFGTTLSSTPTCSSRAWTPGRAALTAPLLQLQALHACVMWLGALKHLSQSSHRTQCTFLLLVLGRRERTAALLNLLVLLPARHLCLGTPMPMALGWGLHFGRLGGKTAYLTTSFSSRGKVSSLLGYARVLAS